MKSKKVQNNRPYPQDVIDVILNEGKKVPFLKRRCLQCGGNYYPKGEPVHEVAKTLVYDKFKLKCTFCSISCIKLYLITQRHVPISSATSTLNAYVREILVDKTLCYPNGPLYEFAPYQWLKIEGGQSYGMKEYAERGINLVKQYDEEEKKHNTKVSEKKMWEHALKFRASIEKKQQQQATENKHFEKTLPSLPPLKDIIDKEEEQKRKIKNKVENSPAQIERTQMRESYILSAATNPDELFSKIEDVHKLYQDLPLWMRWRWIDQTLEKPSEMFDWKAWLDLFENKEKYSETYRIWKEWKCFIPAYTNDEWEQICPSRTEWERYKRMALNKQEQKDLLVCCYHKAPIHGQPVFRPLHYYPGFKHFVFDTKVGFCSGQCIKNWMQEQKEIDYQEDSVILQEYLTTRWNYSFAVQCAPPVSILPDFSDFKITTTIPKSLEQKNIDDHPIRRNLFQIWSMLSTSPFVCPQLEEEFQLCISMNSTVFRMVFPPFSAMRAHLYPHVSDVFPFGIVSSGVELKNLIGPIKTD